MSSVVPLQTQFDKQKPDQVTTYDVSQLFSSYGLNGMRYNPDDLVGKKGLDVYKRMLVDEQVKAVTEFKLDAIVARGHEFQFDESSQLSDEEKAKRISLFNYLLCQMRGSFTDAIENVGTGREMGFSVTEKVYGLVDYQGKQYVGINKMLLRDPCTFEFYTDDYGELQHIKQQVSGRPKVEVNPNKVIHYVHKPKWDVIFGRSELRAAHRSWYAKEQLIKLWLLYLEKFGGGFAVASRLDDSAPVSGTPEFATLQAALSNIGSLRSIILPKGIGLEVHFPSTTDQFEKAIVFHDLAIAKALLVPNLLGLSHAGQTGSFAQSQTQFEAFFWTLNSDSQRLAECLNEQLFRDLGDQNWGDGDYPRFRFKPASMEHTKWVLTTWKEMIGIKAVIPTEEDERFIRGLLEMPPRDPDAEPLVDPMAERQMELEEKQIEQGAQQQKAANDEAYEKAAAATRAIERQILELAARLDAKATPTITVEAPQITVNSSAPKPDDTPPHESHQSKASQGEGAEESFEVHIHGPVIGATAAAVQRAAQRVSFSVIEKRTDDSTRVAVNELATIIAKATRRTLGDDANVTDLIDTDPTDVAALSLAAADTGRIKSVCRSTLERAWQIGSDHAVNELQRAKATAGDTQFKVTAAALRDKASQYFETQSFRMAGDTSDQTRKIIQQELQNAIKFGKSIKDARVSIWERLIAKGLTSREAVSGVETDEDVQQALDALLLDTVDDVRPYLNTLVRTNTFEALNEARFNEFTDPALADFVQALQYAAVLDSSTTTICEYLNDRIYTADSDVWNEFRPPNHFNCRSILIPVTTIDGWDGQESDEPAIEPQEGFK